MNWIPQLQSIPVWKKYSQCNEESYLEFILSQIPEQYKNKVLVDLGAGDGVSLSNTKYFIESAGYKGILVDGNNHGNTEVNQEFLTVENLLDVLEKYDTPLSFDLLSIDLDGNDIYLLDKLLSKYRPAVIVAEFNPIHPAEKSVAIEYNPMHTWGNDDYYGFSFAAGMKCAAKNGYTCIFQNDNLNMYFVRDYILAESLSKDLEPGTQIEIEVQYEITHGHAASTKTTWVEY